jgi:hypothetical protein
VFSVERREEGAGSLRLRDRVCRAEARSYDITTKGQPDVPLPLFQGDSVQALVTPSDTLKPISFEDVQDHLSVQHVYYL